MTFVRTLTTAARRSATRPNQFRPTITTSFGRSVRLLSQNSTPISKKPLDIIHNKLNKLPPSLDMPVAFFMGMGLGVVLLELPYGVKSVYSSIQSITFSKKIKMN